MIDSILEKVLQLASRQAQAAEVYYLSSQDTPVEFENNRLKSLQTKAMQGVALRVICNGRLGFASSTDLTRLEELVTAAVETAQVGDPVEFGFAHDVQFSDSPAGDYTPSTTEALVETGEGLIGQLRAYNPDLLVSVGFHVRSREVKLATSDNVYAQRCSCTESASLSGNLVRGEDFLEIYSSDVARDRAPDCDRLLQEVRRKFQQAERSATITSGTFPVLFSPRAAYSTIGRLFDTLLSGQAVVQNASPLADKLGEQVFDERLTISEDPRIGASACPFDDEGTPTQQKRLIDQGRVNEFYWDRRWAARAGRASSGNGFRSGLSRPSPDLVNLCITPGQTPVEDLIANIKEGLIVEQVLGAGQSNQFAGEFSVNLDLGYKVENGEIVGRVKNTMVAGNIFEAFPTLVDLSDRAQWIGGSAYLPSVLFGQLGVSARQ